MTGTAEHPACSAVSHVHGELGCIPALPGTWVIEFVHGAPGGPCEPIRAIVCEGRRLWVQTIGGHPAMCQDCGRMGVYADLIRAIEHVE